MRRTVAELLVVIIDVSYVLDTIDGPVGKHLRFALIHAAHPTLADFGGDFVDTEPCTRA